MPARGTSITCNACGFEARKNGESRAVFRYRSCGDTDNAEGKTARNMRTRGMAAIRARMDASGPHQTGPAEGAEAGRRNGGQDESRPLATSGPPERAPDPGGDRDFSTAAIRTAQES